MALGRGLVIGSAILAAVFAASAGGPVHSEEKPQVIAKADVSPVSVETPEEQKKETPITKGERGTIALMAGQYSKDLQGVGIAFYVGKEAMKKMPPEKMGQGIIGQFASRGVPARVFYAIVDEDNAASFHVLLNDTMFGTREDLTYDSSYSVNDLASNLDTIAGIYKLKVEEEKKDSLLASVPKPTGTD